MDVVRRFSLLVTAALFAAALIVGAMHDRPATAPAPRSS
jgi:hypothetical protein